MRITYKYSKKGKKTVERQTGERGGARRHVSRLVMRRTLRSWGLPLPRVFGSPPMCRVIRRLVRLLHAGGGGGGQGGIIEEGCGIQRGEGMGEG